MYLPAKIIYTLGILLLVLEGWAQPRLLQIITTDTVIEAYKIPRTLRFEAVLEKELQQELKRWQMNNFLEASFDSIRVDSSKTMAYLHLGPMYAFSSEANVSGKRKNNAIASESILATYWIKLIQKQISELEQNGYPFAMVRLKQTMPAPNKISLELITDSGTYITYDTILVAGNSVQDKMFLMRYLNIQPNDAYDESVVKSIDKKLQQLPFLRVARPTSVIFYKNKAQIMICIDDKPSNNFEGIAGVRTDEQNAGKYKITGDVNLSLNNVMASAGAIRMQWRRFDVQNSDLNVYGNYPYLLGAPIAISNEFILYRQDSNFQRLKNTAGFSYLFSGFNALQFYYIYERSNATLSASQRSAALSNNSLPAVNDYLNKNYGMKFLFRNLDNLFNPTRGANIVLDAGIGSHQIVENAVLKDATYQGKRYTGYDSVLKAQTIFQTSNMMDAYYPVGRRQVINVFVQAASMAHSRILSNEQFQLGGLRTFRGVNELSIKSTTYAMLRTEYRYILPQTGYFNLFCNGIWYESNLANSYKNNALLGFGAGLGIQTKGGILTMVYALANENGFLFKLGKVHVGFTAVF